MAAAGTVMVQDAEGRPIVRAMRGNAPAARRRCGRGSRTGFADAPALAASGADAAVHVVEAHDVVLAQIVA